MNNTLTKPAEGHVLVGVDGSENSRRAFEVALEVARERGWSLRLVAAYSMPFDAFTYTVELKELHRRGITNHAQHILDQCVVAADEAGVEVTTRVVETSPARQLVEASEDARLAVVGKRGRGRLVGRFLGSVSNALAAHASCPILVVPEQAVLEDADEDVEETISAGEAVGDSTGEYLRLVADSGATRPNRRDLATVEEHLNFDREVVVGIDRGRTADTVALQAADHAEALGRPLTLVMATPTTTDVFGYVMPAYDAFREGCIKQLERVAERVADEHPDLDIHWQSFDGDPATVLAQASRTACVVALGTRGHGGFAGLLLGSVSQKVLARAVSPVLVVPTKPPQ